MFRPSGLIYRRQNILNLRSPQACGVTTSYGNGTVLTPNATAHTKGSWAQVIASTTAQARMVLVRLNANPTDTTSLSYLVDIGTGASSSEVVLIPNLVNAPGAQWADGICNYMLPLVIPAGTRIAARAQCVGASGATMPVTVTIFDADPAQVPYATGVDALGVSTATTLGQAITQGVSNAKGSWAQITASTSRDYIGFVVSADGQNTGGTYNYSLVDIGVGAAGSEQIIVPDWGCKNNAGTIFNGVSPFFPIRIPTGSRIAVRAASGGNPAGALGISIYGVY